MQDFKTAVAEIVGADNVTHDGDAAFNERYFRDPYAFSENFRYAPPGAISPSNASEVQAVIKLANEHKIGLWTVSRGRNLGYGAAMPRRESDWVLDLSRMNRVLHVNQELGYAVIEPGVSFFDLYAHLRENKVPFFVSVPDLGYGSVLANALERGLGYSKKGDHSQHLCGFEVVTPTGEMLHTGMRADSDARAAFAYKGGFGPDIHGLFQQSNFGVVTNAAIWLTPIPEVFAAVRVSVQSPDDLGALVDTLRPLHLASLIDSPIMVGNILAIASGVMPRSAIWQGDDIMPPQVIEGLANKMHLGYWNAKFGLYGPKAVIDAKLASIKAAVAAALPEADFAASEYPGDFDEAAVFPGDYAQLAIPSGNLIQMAAWRGGVPAHTDYCAVSPTTGKDAQEIVNLTKGILNRNGLDHAGGFTIYGRHSIFLSLIAFDGSSEVDRKLVDNVYEELLEKGDALGFAPYRAHPRFMDKISAMYGADDGGLQKYLQKMKRAVDPNSILSIGKQGIW